MTAGDNLWNLFFKQYQVILLMLCFCFCLSYAGAEGWKGIRKGNSLQAYNALPLSSELNLQVTQILQ